MNIVHLCNTPLAGFPYRLSQAINRYTEHNSRSVVGMPGYGPRTFPYDLLWTTDRVEIEEVLRKADTYVYHSYFGMKNNSWKVQNYLNPNDRVTAHYCVQPGAGNLELAKAGVPTSVSAQYHTRHYTHSRPLPNIMMIEDELYRPKERKWPPEVPLKVAFSPSNMLGRAQMKGNPWSVKGYPETRTILEEFQARHKEDFRYEIIYNRPIEECLRIRSECHVSIDELMTGSYHNVTLESMSQGLLTLVYMDPQTLQAMAAVAGQDAVESLPLVNIQIHELRKTLQNLLDAREALRGRAEACRAWMEAHWHPERLAKLYTEFWETIPPYRILVPPPPC